MLGFPKDDDTIGGLFGVNEEDRHGMGQGASDEAGAAADAKAWSGEEGNDGCLRDCCCWHYFADACSVHRRGSWHDGERDDHDDSESVSKHRPELEEIRRESPSGGYEFGG